MSQSFERARLQPCRFQKMSFLNLLVYAIALAFWELGQNAAESVA
jgi:hypothetical protein